MNDQAGDDVMAVVRVQGMQLPPRSVRMIAAEDRRERQEARAAKRERADRAEAAHDRALEAFRADAELRGDEVTVMGLMSGEGVPTVADVLTRARVQAESQDAYAESLRPGGKAPDEVMYPALMPDPPVPPKTPIGRAMANTLRRFTREHPDADVIDRAKFAAELKASLRRGGVR